MADSEDVMLEEEDEANSQLLELQNAFVAALTQNGTIGKLRAQLRASALALMRGDDNLQRAAIGFPNVVTSLTAEGRLALLLIEDFLQAHGLRESEGVFREETSLDTVSQDDVETYRSAFPAPSDTPRTSTLEWLVKRALEGDTQSGTSTSHPTNTTAPASSAIRTSPDDTRPDKETTSPPKEEIQKASHAAANASDSLELEPPSTLIRSALQEYVGHLMVDDQEGPMDFTGYDDVHTV